MRGLNGCHEQRGLQISIVKRHEPTQSGGARLDEWFRDLDLRFARVLYVEFFHRVAQAHLDAFQLLIDDHDPLAPCAS